MLAWFARADHFHLIQRRAFLAVGNQVSLTSADSVDTMRLADAVLSVLRIAFSARHDLKDVHKEFWFNRLLLTEWMACRQVPSTIVSSFLHRQTPLIHSVRYGHSRVRRHRLPGNRPFWIALGGTDSGVKSDSGSWLAIDWSGWHPIAPGRGIIPVSSHTHWWLTHFAPPVQLVFGSHSWPGAATAMWRMTWNNLADFSREFYPKIPRVLDLGFQRSDRQWWLQILMNKCSSHLCISNSQCICPTPHIVSQEPVYFQSKI